VDIDGSKNAICRQQVCKSNEIINKDGKCKTINCEKNDIFTYKHKENNGTIIDLNVTYQ
jgi:hypothetical protein